MKLEDIKETKIISNNNPIENSLLEAERPGGKGGILRMNRNSFKTDAEYQTMQEQHNAGHILYFLSIIADSVISGRTTGNDQQKIERIKAHLMTLREFIDEDRLELSASITLLLERVNKVKDAKRDYVARFIFENWLLIYIIAEAYGHHERCFSNDKYAKLSDVVQGRFYLKLWWWQMRAKREVLRMKRAISIVKVHFGLSR